MFHLTEAQAPERERLAGLLERAQAEDEAIRPVLRDARTDVRRKAA